MGAPDKTSISESAVPTNHRRQREPVPEWRIIICALAMCGIQVCYAAQINMGTSELLLLGISEQAVSLAWLAGPLSGLIFQPIIGYFSDGCTHFLGRRRPFLIAGCVFTTLALLLFSHASRIAFWVSGPSAQSHALGIAICAFFILDFSIQAIQAPLRALITDVVPKPQRALANSYIGVFTGLGNLLGGLLAAVQLSKILPFFDRDVEALFATSAFILVITVAACVIYTHEERLPYRGYTHVSSHASTAPPTSSSALLEQQNDQESSSFGSGYRGFMQALRGIPRPFWQVFAVQLCTWCGFFTLFVYINTWVGRNIYLGNGSSPVGSEKRNLFESGVRLGGKGNAVTALVTLLYSLGLPWLVRHFGVIPVYVFSQLIEAGSLMAAPLLHGRVGQTSPSFLLRALTMLDIGVFGVVWATTMGLPWTLIGNALEIDPRYAKNLGLFTTLFNASQSFPQLLVAFCAPFILRSANDDPAAVMFIGGICAIAGAVLAVVLRVDKYSTDSHFDEESFTEEEDEWSSYELRVNQSLSRECLRDYIISGN